MAFDSHAVVPPSPWGRLKPSLPRLKLTLQQWASWGECALELAFPWPESNAVEPVRIEAPFCQQCGFPFPALAKQETEFTCGNCLDQKWFFAWARSGFQTEGEVREAIVGFKYRDEYYRRASLVSWLVETFDRFALRAEWDALVPVPLYRLRRRERGFNQALELANGLGKARGLPVKSLLYRYRETPSQTSLARGARRQNVEKAFKLKHGFDVKGLNLLLIDDVFTTGATSNACARVLAQNGASRVAVLTVARS